MKQDTCNSEIKDSGVDIAEPCKMDIRYQRARALMQGIWTKKVVLNSTVFPIWIGESDCFWYVHDFREEGGSATENGFEYRLVNAHAASTKTAFDHSALADALANASKQKVEANRLPIKKVKIELHKNYLVETVWFSAFTKYWRYDISSGICEEVTASAPLDNSVISPDGKYAVFSKGYDLWIRDIERNESRALTTDGEEFFIYGATGTAWGKRHNANLQVRWSPDSKRLFTVQKDIRQVKTLPVVHHVPKDGSVRPQVQNIKLAYPGDEHVEEVRLLVIDIINNTIQSIPYKQLPAIRNGDGFFTEELGWWAADSQRIYFVDMSRDNKSVKVMEFDIRTEVIRQLFEETSPTQINLMLNSDEYPSFIPLPESGELLWYSERSGWAHLYLYDLESGELKNPVTLGDWLVRTVVHFDPKCREVFLQTAGRVPDRDPYYRDFVRVNIDTGEMVTLASSNHEYVVAAQKDLLMITASSILGYENSCAVSNTGNFAVVTRSRADEIPVSLLIDRNGQEVLTLATADVSALPDGWHWPEPVKLKAADGETDIYGLVYRPSDFCADKSYPIVSHLFNTPELTCVPKGSFTNESAFGWFYLDPAALAELGFIVVQIDGRGTPFRSKAFHDESYGWIESASKLEDHMSGLRQLAERYPYIDIDRVGITTHASGGPGALQGLLQYPEFYKVGVANQLHDSRTISAVMWGDKYEGLSGPNSDHQYPEHYVEQLKGKLLLMDGMLDTTSTPAATFRVVEALQKANKDFDLILLPNLIHDVSSYLVRRAWDYLVTNLLGEQPPKEFRLKGVFGDDEK